MKLPIAVYLPLMAVASPVDESARLNQRQSAVLNATVEYATQCKTCPWNLCTNVVIPAEDQVVNVTCWTEGDLIDDTRLWLKTGDNCYISEYDLIESDVDYREELEYCGSIPQEITRQDATIRYLTVCNWRRDIRGQSIEHYGRDLDVTLTCWGEGDDVIGNTYWYKTTDNCHVAGANLWGRPVLDGLDYCGPNPPKNLNESELRVDLRDNDESPSPSAIEYLDELSPDKVAERDGGESLKKRWLFRDQIGEEYAPCFSCPTETRNSTCGVKKVYEFDDWVVSQCYTREEFTYPNGTFQLNRWRLTSDWCYVEDRQFWDQPEFKFYPECNLWEGY